jgi:hypothetical protein
MSHNPSERPDPSFQRKAAIASGAAIDHRGEVTVSPMVDFDLRRTIFNTLEGRIPRFVMQARIAKEAHFAEAAAQRIQRAYEAAEAKTTLPAIPAELLRFLIEECDFDVEHADGSFLDHLYFCFEYGALHYREHSALVLLLHSILGTGTNTFAMQAEKIPALRALLGDCDWTHVEAFPSVLRLLYDLPLRHELRANTTRLSALKEVHFHRVIDNAPIRMSAEDFFIQLNYQLIHLVDFLPVANWPRYANDSAFILFRDLYDLLERSGKKATELAYTPSHGSRALDGEEQSFAARLTTLIPVSVSEKMAARAVRRFSSRIGHSMDYTLRW